jgi:hypothetical protein
VPSISCLNTKNHHLVRGILAGLAIPLLMLMASIVWGCEAENGDTMGFK